MLKHFTEKNLRRLDNWLFQLDSSYPEGYSKPGDSWQHSLSPRQLQAADAIKRMGTPAVRYLIQDINAPDVTIRGCLSEFLQYITKEGIVSVDRKGRKHRAILCVAVLGSAAASAIPALTNAQKDFLVSEEASMALASIGTNGWLVLNQELTNSPSYVRAGVIVEVGNYHIVMPGTIDALMDIVTNKSGESLLPLQTLGLIGKSDERVVPFLENILHCPSPDDRYRSALSLACLGPNAKPAVPFLLQAMNDENAKVRRGARLAVQMIDPQALPPIDPKLK